MFFMFYGRRAVLSADASSPGEMQAQATERRRRFTTQRRRLVPTSS